MRGAALARLVVTGTALLATAACVAPPLSHPLLLGASQDATAEIQALLGTPPPVEKDAARLVATIADALAKQTNPGCEVLPAAEVVWRAPASPTTAAIELRVPCDDSVAGAWYELTITGDDQTGFVVALATKQSICKRGVSGTLCV
jgi:hypothetical protein